MSIERHGGHFNIYEDSDGTVHIGDGHGGSCYMGEARWIIEVAQRYIDSFTSEKKQQADHSNGRICDVPDCDRCQRIIWREKMQRLNCTRPTRIEAGIVYLAHANDEYKIGTTQDISKRVYGLRKELGRDVKVIHCIETQDRYNLEFYWHCHFVDRFLHNECFALTDEDIAEFCSHTSMEVDRIHPRERIGLPIREETAEAYYGQ
jgi:hypothetical protein